MDLITYCQEAVTNHFESIITSCIATCQYENANDIFQE